MAQKTKRFAPSKAVERQWKVYLEQLEETGVELPEFEALRPFMGKRGRVLKSKTRSRAAQAAYQEAEQGVKGTYGNRAGATAIGKRMKQQDRQNRAQKAVETHRRRREEARRRQEAVQKAQEEAAQEAEKEEEQEAEAETPDDQASQSPEEKKDEAVPQKEESMVDRAKRALREAEENARKAQQALEDAKRDLSYAELIESFQKGSREKLSNRVKYLVYTALEAQGVEPEDIDAYLEKLEATVNDVPDEALALWNEDEFATVLTALHEFNETEREDFTSALTAVIESEKEDAIDVMEAIRYWEKPENNQRGMSFKQFWESTKDYNNPLERSTWEEILGGDPDE